jgi:hypothetical protein
MQRQSAEMATGALLLLGAVMLVTPGVAATPEGGVDRSASAATTVRLSARGQGSSRFHVVDNGATLHVGDEVRIEMTAEEESYAYVFHRGASGDWALLFPNPDQSGDAGAENPVLPGEICSVPGDQSRLVLNDVSGIEELVIYVLPHPDRAVADLATRLRRGERVRIRLDGPPPDAETRFGQSSPTAPLDESKETLLAMRDLTFVPSKPNGGARLPANYAIRYIFRNAENPGATKLN